jgi:hypothetical protein
VGRVRRVRLQMIAGLGLFAAAGSALVGCAPAREPGNPFIGPGGQGSEAPLGDRAVPGVDGAVVADRGHAVVATGNPR